MLVRITNKCNSNCTHCGIDASGPDGQHMDQDTWNRFLEFNKKYDFHTIVSGGESFLHPNLRNWIGQLISTYSLNRPIVIATNGTLLKNKEYMGMTSKFIRNGCMLQITNDSRYYSVPFTLEDYTELIHKFPVSYLGRIIYQNKVQSILPCNRTRQNNIPGSRLSPTCFNLRSAVKYCGFIYAIEELRSRPFPFFCSPSINVDGSIVAGEFDSCQKIGNIFDTEISEIESNLLKKCNKCGLMDNLNEEQRRAIQ
jgi:hypothetical protein